MINTFVVHGKFVCDRHGGEVEGAFCFSTRSEELPPILMATSGVYVRSQHWAQFFSADEQKICDACMKEDARYQKFMRGQEAEAENAGVESEAPANPSPDTDATMQAG